MKLKFCPKQEKLSRSQTRQLFLIDARIKVAIFSWCLSVNNTFSLRLGINTQTLESREENLVVLMPACHDDLFMHNWKFSFNTEFIMTGYALLVWNDRGEIQTGSKQVDNSDAIVSPDNAASRVCLGCVCYLFRPWLMW